MTWINNSLATLLRTFKSTAEEADSIKSEAIKYAEFLGDKSRKISNDQEKLFDFDNRLKRSKVASLVSSRFRSLNCILNQLAQRFEEDIVMERRKGRQTSTANEIPLLPAHHRFFVAPHKGKDPDDAGVFSEVYHEELPPDSRLIYIGVDQSVCHSALSVLHEMGHFIGIRMRRTRLENFFLPMIAHGFCFDLYYDVCDMCSCGEQIDGYLTDYVKEGLIYPEYLDVVNETMHEAAKLRDKLEKYFAAHVIQELDKLLFDDDEPITLDENDPYLLLKRQRVSSIMGFFQSVRGVVLEHLSRFVEQELTAEHSELLCIALSRHKQEIDFAIKSGDVPTWYRFREEQFEEAIADVFMMRISRASIPRFLDNLIYQYQVTYKTDSVTLANGLLLPRAIGICRAANATAKSFSRWYDPIVKLLPFFTRAKARYELRQRLSICYYEAQSGRYSRSFDIIYRYIDRIWKDEDYDKFYKNNKSELRRLRRLICTSKPLLHLLYWLWPTTKTKKNS